MQALDLTRRSTQAPNVSRRLFSQAQQVKDAGLLYRCCTIACSSVQLCILLRVHIVCR